MNNQDRELFIKKQAEHLARLTRDIEDSKEANHIEEIKDFIDSHLGVCLAFTLPVGFIILSIVIGV